MPPFTGLPDQHAAVVGAGQAVHCAVGLHERADDLFPSGARVDV